MYSIHVHDVLDIETIHHITTVVDHYNSNMYHYDREWNGLADSFLQS